MESLARELVAVMLDCHRRSRQGQSHGDAQLKYLKETFRQKSQNDRALLLREMMKVMNETAQAAGTQRDSDLLYRAFDPFDELLSIAYELDHGMPSNPEQKERLYEGAGVGVQTCYSSILLALEQANAQPGARVLDLGSGYGRVGFVIGLLRPDIQFQGFEYVGHRVQDSNRVAFEAKLANVGFITQDLAEKTFQIPEADIYYMYDPFSKETYGSVLAQLLELGRQRPVTIITKGRANTWVSEALTGHGWSEAETCDHGTISIFRSLPRAAQTNLVSF